MMNHQHSSTSNDIVVYKIKYRIIQHLHMYLVMVLMAAAATANHQPQENFGAFTFFCLVYKITKKKTFCACVIYDHLNVHNYEWWSIEWATLNSVKGKLTLDH